MRPGIAEENKRVLTNHKMLPLRQLRQCGESGPSRRLSAPGILPWSGDLLSATPVACRQIKTLADVMLHAEQKFTDQLFFHAKL